jgi:hypothetical protein
MVPGAEITFEAVNLVPLNMVSSFTNDAAAVTAEEALRVEGTGLG